MQTSSQTQLNPPSVTKLDYRPELEGLRALALILVMGFHAQIPGFEAGFLGVDLFFVLSGYLITRLIYSQVIKGTFSLAKFYTRRAWRLFPTLWLVILASTGFAYYLLSPILLKDFGQSIVASLLFVSNFLFWHESGYFQTESLDKVLIHTWSLGIEEQFYLLFPLLLLALIHQKKASTRSLIWGLTLPFILSLAFTEWAWRTQPSLNYYLLLSRLWTFICGALIAVYELNSNKPSLSIRAQNAFAYLGTVGLLGSILLYDHWMPSPSLLTLLPIFSMVLLIIGIQATGLINKLLCFKPLRYLGLISYSAYLWHQPCLALSRQFLIQDRLNTSQITIVLGMSLVLAQLTYIFVERPYRRNDLKLSQRVSLRILVGSSLMLIALGSFIHLSQGMSSRLSKAQHTQLDQIHHYGRGANHPCPYDGFYSCQFGSPEIPATYALAGDSHAGMYAGAFQRALNTKGLSMAYAGDGWCIPLVDLYTNDFRRNQQVCQNQMTPALHKIAESPQIHTVFLAATWTHYIEGKRHGRLLSPYYYKKDLKLNALNSDDSQLIKQATEQTDEQTKEQVIRQQNQRAFTQALTATLALFKKHQKRVIIIAPVPEYAFSVPKRMAQLSFRNLGFDSISQSLTQYQQDHRLFFELMRQQDISAKSTQSISLWPTDKQLCPQQHCRSYQAQAQAYYFDSNHLSPLGAEQVVKAIMNSKSIFP